MKAVTALHRLGGTASWLQLRRAVHWRHIDAALDEGVIVRTGRGRYVLATVADGRAAAHRLSGTASHTTAALHWGWKVKTAPAQPHVTVRAKRSLKRGAAGVTVHWRDLLPDEVRRGWVTSKARTVIDCCLDLPFDEALSVFDSALRSGLPESEVLGLADWLAPRQRAKVRRVARVADGRAANPFESVLRALALEVEGLEVEPQYEIADPRFYARVDLADERLRIVIEADSFEFHGQRKQLDRDCRRYTRLGVRGWLVLRFSWEQVMLEPDFVVEMLRAAVALRAGQVTGSSHGSAAG